MHKTTIARVLLTLAVIFLGQVAHAQGTTVSIHGTDLVCRDAAGQPVPVWWTEDAMAKGGGAWAQVLPGSGTSILLSPTFIAKLPRLGAFLVFFHECAHVALPMGVGLGTPAQERNADCHAVAEMQRRGLITSWKEFETSTSAMVASLGHIQAADRISQAAKCLRVVKASTDKPICKIIESGFSLGWDWVKSKADADKAVIPNHRCRIHEKSKELACDSGPYDEDDAKLRAAIAKDITQCLEGFQYAPGHLYYSWENRELRKQVLLGRADGTSFLTLVYDTE